MPQTGYSGSVGLSTHVRGTPRKQPIWRLRYRTPNNPTGTDKSLGPAWIDGDLWRQKQQVKHLRSRPANGFLTQAQAQVVADAFLQEIQDAPPQDRRTVGEASLAFVKQKKREGVDDSTHYGYESCARVLCDRSWRGTKKTWGEQALDAVTPADIERLQNQMMDEDYSVSSLNHFGHIVRGAFGRDSAQAKAWKWARDKKKNSQRTRFYSPEQVRTLIDHAVYDWERALYHVAAQQGLRRSEILGLRRIDIDYGAMIIRVANGFTRTGGMGDTKSHQARSVPMTRQTAEALRPFTDGLPLHNADSEALLVFSRDGHGLWPLDPDSVSRRFIRTRKKAGLPEITLHELRHTFGTQAMASGKIDIYTLQRLMGHQEITTTQRYLHFAPRPELGDTLSAIWEAPPEAEVIPIRRAS